MNFAGAETFILDKLGKELPATLTYHNITHVLDVLEAVNRYIEVSDITEEDKVLLRTAALYHDSGFIKQADGHELISCAIAREFLPLYNYTDGQIKRVCGMIMATRIPQIASDRLEQILADADLDYLGRDDFWVISGRLFLELKNRGVVASEREWNIIQVNFFEAHTYFTPEARNLRDKKKQQNLKQIKARLTDYTS